MKIPKYILLSFVILLGFSRSVHAGLFTSDDAMVSESRLLMGTTVEIKVPAGTGYGRKVIDNAMDRAFAEIERVEGLFSVYKKTSEVSRINKLKKDRPLRISSEVFDLIERCKEYTEKTGGAFDVTVKPLVDLWGFGGGEKSEVRSQRSEVRGQKSEVRVQIPSDDEIKNALECVGSQYIVLDSEKMTISFKKDGMAIDLGGAAKGYATDCAVSVLKSLGIDNAVVNSGGDMYCLGRKSRKNMWKAGVTHPRKKGSVFFELRLENKAIATSGDYEKYFEIDGRRYSHIIDPRTGYLVDGNVVSASVAADSAATADILATALCVLGDEALWIVELVSGADALLVMKEGTNLKTEMTKGFKAGYNVIKSDL